jgi:flagellar M-ring protein FliF
MSPLDQLRGLAANLTTRQKVVVAATALAVVASLALFVRWNGERGFSPLYTNLAPEDAAAVVGRLRESGTEYRLGADSKTVLVKAERIPEARLQMASAGLPKTGRIGFELFDRNNFAATEFAEQVNFNRALEGELERTVSTISEVESVRVHITPPKDSIYLDHKRPAKASVLLKLRADRQLSPKNVAAVSQLVSNAVDGLSPEQVSVLDIHGNLLSRQKKDNDEEDVNTARMEYRRNIERDLLAKVNSTLEPLLGPERFRAAVSVEVDYSTSDQSEEAFDPVRSVMTTSQRTEDTASAAQPSGVPGAPSSLPRPTSRPGSAGAGGLVRRSENINYQTTRTVKRTHIPHGTVRRISAGVLMDHNAKWEGQGDKARLVMAAPSPEQLKATRDVVSGALGLEPDRGDQLVVESLPFEQTVALASPRPVPAGPVSPGGGGAGFAERIQKRDPVALGILGAAAAAVLVGAVLFWLVRRRRRKATVALDSAKSLEARKGRDPDAPAGESGRLDHGAGEGGRGRLEGMADDGLDLDELPEPGSALARKLEMHHRAAMAERAKLEESQEKEILDNLGQSMKLPSAKHKKAEVLAKQLVAESKRNPGRFAQIVRTWASDLE